MSLLGNLLGTILGKGAQPKPTASTPASTSTPAPTSTPASKPSAASTPTSTAATTPSTSSPASEQHVDVTAILDDLAAKNPEKLDWRHSIVDLMKLVGIDSSLHERKELAKELHYTGDTDDSATMNIWLHKQVITKLAENGGKVPADLLK
jgi:3-oxoacyl-ACP reductase-like protein